MVVIAIMLILASIVSGALNSNKSTSESAVAVASIFNEARSQAIARQTICAVLVDTDPADTNKGYLSRTTVAYLSNNNFVQTLPWQSLPSGVYYYYPAHLISDGKLNQISLSSQGIPTFNGVAAPSYDCYMFLPNGQSYSSSLCQVIVSPGSCDTTGTFIPRGTNKLYGFAISRMGRPMFIQNLADIR